MRPDEQPDVGLEAIMAAFERHGVAYVVIGGEAARARGWPEQTEDVDVTPERSKENLARLADALEELGAGFRVDPVRYPDGFRPPGGIDWRTFRNQVWVTLTTRHGDIDVVLTPDGTDGYEEIAKTATRERLEGTEIAVPVASAEMILKSKTAADRPKDHAVLDRMRDILNPLSDRGTLGPPDRSRPRDGREPPGR
jgi:predicted nucleotidyltransferase